MVLHRDLLVVGLTLAVAASLYMFSFRDLIASDRNDTVTGTTDAPAQIVTIRQPATAG
jgi:hypothetical protein